MLEVQSLFPHENSVSVRFYTTLLRPNRPVTMRKTLLEENFEVVSEIYFKNILHQFFCTDSSSVVTVSP